ncbi:unnamed protein product [Closterium sp. NIES-54]
MDHLALRTHPKVELRTSGRLPNSVQVCLFRSSDFATASALVAELLDFAAACRLENATTLVAESASTSPPSVGCECALGTDVLEDGQEDFECLAAAVPRFASMLLAPEGDPDAPDIPTPRSYAEAITGPYSSQWQASMDAEMASWKSTGTYVDEVPSPEANIVDGIWIFRVKRPPGSPPAFKARYVARGFSQRHGVYYFQTFSPTPKMTTLWVLLHVAAQRDYELHSLDFSTAFLQGSLHEEIWLRRPRGFFGSFPACTQWSLRRPVYGLSQAPREWHDTLRTTLAAPGLAPSTVDPSLFLCSPPIFKARYIARGFRQRQGVDYFQTFSPTPKMTTLRVLLHVAAQRDYELHSLDFSTAFLQGSLHEEIWLRRLPGFTGSFPACTQWSLRRLVYGLRQAPPMAAQELRWLTYLLTDLGEVPRSPPVL